MPRPHHPHRLSSSSSARIAPRPFTLSVAVPVHNEEATVAQVVTALLALEVPGGLEVLVVDDGSTDATPAILARLADPRLSVARLATNQGKGAAVRHALAAASGTHLVVFDADSEYRAADLVDLCAPVVEGRAEVVYGVRVHGNHTLHPSLVHLVGNRLMTWAANVVYGAAISDLHTCLKLAPVPLLRSLTLRERGFGLDTEITAEILRRGFRPFEVPVTYAGRSKEEGKKIRPRDALECLAILARVRLRGRTPYGRRDRRLTPPVAFRPAVVPAALAEEHGPEHPQSRPAASASA